MSFKKVSKLYGFISKLYFVYIFVLVAAVFTGIYEYYSYTHLPSNYNPEYDLLPVDILTFFVGLIQTITSLILIINFFRFIHRVSKNLQFQFNEKLIASPGWSVGYFFIPILSLFKPYQVVKNILEVASKGEDYNKSLLRFWWALWLISGYIGTMILRYSISSWNVDSDSVMTIIYIISDSIDIITNIIEFKVVKMIAEFFINNYERNISADNSEKDFSFLNY